MNGKEEKAAYLGKEERIKSLNFDENKSRHLQYFSAMNEWQRRKNKTLELRLMLLACHKKSYLICVEFSNFSMFKTETANRAETAA